MPHSLEFSVVVPVHNESGNVAKLIGEIAAALDGRAYEMIFVDDASTDDTRAKLAELKAQYPALRVLGHRKNAGQSRAIRSGIMAARKRSKSTNVWTWFLISTVACISSSFLFVIFDRRVSVPLSVKFWQPIRIPNSNAGEL